MVRGVAQPVSPCINCRKPSWIPSTSAPPRTERIVAAPITLLMPGAGPPPHRIPTRFVPLIGRRIACALVIEDRTEVRRDAADPRDRKEAGLPGSPSVNGGGRHPRGERQASL